MYRLSSKLVCVKPSSACKWSGGFSQGFPVFLPNLMSDLTQNEPRSEKTGLRGF